MSESTSLLLDAIERISQEVHAVVVGLGPDQLGARIAPDANSIAWLIWHLTRVQDSHLCELAQQEQVWISGGWFGRFGLPFDTDATGYGQSSRDVAEVRDVDGEQLIGYFEAVHDQTTRIIGELKAADLASVVDETWDPPVTLAARLVSVISDDLQHVGQAAFIRGLLEQQFGHGKKSLI